MFSGFLARRWRPVIIATFVCAAVAGAAGLSAVLALRSAGGQNPAREVASRQQTPAVGENPVATVNGEPIASTGFRARLRLQELNAAAGLPTATPMQIVDSLINDKLLRQEAKRRGLECTDEQLR
ncbi:MAG TPA: SurA N-terminal domain-containing protein, partial [Dehalococcoidia bacterium]|nr:SurA N-terminal domain-containing protein [Dehalococcoidia bacterium]